MQQIISIVYKVCGISRTAQFLDNIKELGFKMAYEGVLSMGLGDIQIPDAKQSLVDSDADILFIISSATLSVHFDQASTTLLYFSP